MRHIGVHVAQICAIDSEPKSISGRPKPRVRGLKNDKRENRELKLIQPSGDNLGRSHLAKGSKRVEETSQVLGEFCLRYLLTVDHIQAQHPNQAIVLMVGRIPHLTFGCGSVISLSLSRKSEV